MPPPARCWRWPPAPAAASPPRAAMFETNVEGTRTALDAAAAAGVSRIVYVSTVGVFGNTHGQVVDETYERPDRDFLSYYDATKFLAHTIAAERAAAGGGTGPARDDPRQRRGDVLGVERQGETRARLRPSRPQPGPARPAQHGSSRLTYTRATAFASPAPRVRSCAR